MGFLSSLAAGYILHGGKRGPHPKSIKARIKRHYARERQAAIAKRQRGGYRDPRDFWFR
ncbi:hypothetical protein [Rhodococcus phage REQ1]|uniref:hypothetical protein n=1 Tax=Rhodococcus phage REQ1 TaxID=1109712 RepID=UPI00023EEBED|nr:hypothetical protein RoPhREQ1_gp12 [Rhodococcus phage REQ1]AEV52008.1 hypothetical protein [Rhodococcus phage REQ1]